MRKVLLGFVVCLLVMSVATASFAASGDMKEKVKGRVQKLGRGVANVISAPLEIGKQITNEWRSADVKHFALVGGLAKGLGYTLKRLGSGLVDIVTFPVELKEEYDPVMKPEYVFDN